MEIKFAVGFLAVATMLIAGLFSRTALADYPEPNGSVEVTVSVTKTRPGTGLSLTAIVRNQDGSPVPSAPCTVSISSQPGSDANVTQDTTETNPSGVIAGTLFVGSNVGSVVVKVECATGPGPSDVLSGSVKVVVNTEARSGDVNCDGTVNSIDALLIFQLVARLLGVLPCPEGGDVNGDGVFNAIDAALILQFEAGLLPSLPV